jgi:hypothetical protein
MGEKLLKLREFAVKNTNAMAKMRLAMMTQIPSDKVASEPDSPENVAKFKEAVKQITGKEPVTD